MVWLGVLGSADRTALLPVGRPRWRPAVCCVTCVGWKPSYTGIRIYQRDQCLTDRTGDWRLISQGRVAYRRYKKAGIIEQLWSNIGENNARGVIRLVII